MAEPPSPADSSEQMLQHLYRVEDHTVSVLIEKLEAANVSPERLGHVAQQVLEMAHSALSRSELAGLIERASEDMPELKFVSVQEELFVKEQAEAIIKSTVEQLLSENEVEEALALAKTINNGQLPAELQSRIDSI